jgi:hypothetical protein
MFYTSRQYKGRVAETVRRFPEFREGFEEFLAHVNEYIDQHWSEAARSLPLPKGNRI